MWGLAKGSARHQDTEGVRTGGGRWVRRTIWTPPPSIDSTPSWCNGTDGEVCMDMYESYQKVRLVRDAEGASIFYAHDPEVFKATKQAPEFYE